MYLLIFDIRFIKTFARYSYFFFFELWLHILVLDINSYYVLVLIIMYFSPSKILSAVYLYW